MLSIIPFEDRYTQDVIDLVLHFQNDGTRPPVSVDDQPDLLHITESYKAAIFGSRPTTGGWREPSELCLTPMRSLC